MLDPDCTLKNISQIQLAHIGLIYVDCMLGGFTSKKTLIYKYLQSIHTYTLCKTMHLYLI